MEAAPPKLNMPLLNLLKTLADDTRLTMIQLMSGQERNVGELAGLLGLTEPTVSHHLSKLHSASLLNLRMAGNQRFYRVNPKKLAQFKEMVAHIEKPLEEQARPVSDNAWIDALDWPEADKKVLRECTLNGRLTTLPGKEKKWIVVLQWLATRFEPGQHYTEQQVNTILSEVHQDYASLRRGLVDYGFMRRERGGGDYWRTPDDETA